jgi:hypothetical protein
MTSLASHVDPVLKTGAIAASAGEFEAGVVVQNKLEVANDVIALELCGPDGQPLPPWSPGANVDLILAHAPTRQSSLCGDVTDHATWRLGILREQHGRGGAEIQVSTAAASCWQPNPSCGGCHPGRDGPRYVVRPLHWLAAPPIRAADQRPFFFGHRM